MVTRVATKPIDCGDVRMNAGLVEKGVFLAVTVTPSVNALFFLQRKTDCK